MRSIMASTKTTTRRDRNERNTACIRPLAPGNTEFGSFHFLCLQLHSAENSLDWRGLGAFSAFIIALFAEMYGFPLTIYFLSGWLQTRFPQTDIFSHDSGHLWYSVLGFEGNPHANPIHLLANILIIAGFYLTYRGWVVLHEAQKTKSLATSGPYRYVRHPQYCGFILVMLGFLAMWPTILTLAMFPVLLIVYLRLARKEEEMVTKEFGRDYLEYCESVPRFFPQWRS